MKIAKKILASALLAGMIFGIYDSAQSRVQYPASGHSFQVDVHLPGGFILRNAIRMSGVHIGGEIDEWGGVLFCDPVGGTCWRKTAGGGIEYRPDTSQPQEPNENTSKSEVKTIQIIN